MNPIYFIFIMIYAILPMYLMVRKKYVFMTYWIMQGIFIDIFSVQYHGNISSFKLSGLILIPFVFKKLKDYLIKASDGKVLLAYLMLLYLSFFVSGFLIQPGPMTMKIYFKGIKQLLTFSSEVAIGFFLAERLIKDKEHVLRGAVFGIIFSFLGVFLEKILNFDFFSIMTNSKPLLIENRARGFAYEPRAASQHIVYSIFAILVLNILSSIYRLTFFLIAILGLYLTMSLTSIILLPTGMVIIFMTLIFKGKLNLKKIITYIGIGAVLVALIVQFLPSKFKTHIAQRSYIISGGKIIDKLEPSESTVVNYYIQNPKRLFWGIGTGLMNSITKKYTLDSWLGNWPDGVSYLPFMGLFLVLANVGIFGLVVLMLFIYLGLRKIWKNDSLEAFQIAIVTLLLFFLQVRYFHVLGFAYIFKQYVKKLSNGTLVKS